MRGRWFESNLGHFLYIKVRGALVLNFLMLACFFLFEISMMFSCLGLIFWWVSLYFFFDFFSL